MVVIHSPKNVLLVRMGGLGDLLVSFPSIYLLRRMLSPCFITLICRQEYGILLQQTGIVDDLISVDNRSISPFFDTVQPPSQQFSAWLNKFDLIVGWFQSKQSFFRERLLAFKKRRDIGFIIAQKDIQEPLNHYFFRRTAEIIARKESLATFSDCLFLPLSSKQKEEGLKLLGSNALEKKKLVIIHPGSGNRKKCWPLPNFLALIKRLGCRGVKGALITGIAEDWAQDELKSFCWPKDWLWLRNPSLIKLAGLLAQASFYVGNDSGITHLAAACRTKGLALFRQDLEKLWQPVGLINTLSAPCVSQIKKEEVWANIRNWL